MSERRTELEGRWWLDDKYVFHFTTQKNAQSIIETNELRFGSFADSNDPTEYAIGKRISEKYDPSHDDSIIEWIWTALKTQFFCASHNIGDAFGFADERMWAYYADSHRGCALVIDKSRLEKHLSVVVPQGYRHSDRVVAYEELSQHGDMLKRLSTKSKRWEHENEIRWLILPDRGVAQNIANVRIPALDSVRGVILGSRVEVEQQSFWKNCNNHLRNSLFQIDWHASGSDAYSNDVLYRPSLNRWQETPGELDWVPAGALPWQTQK